MGQEHAPRNLAALAEAPQGFELPRGVVPRVTLRVVFMRAGILTRLVLAVVQPAGTECGEDKEAEKDVAVSVTGAICRLSVGKQLRGLL